METPVRAALFLILIAAAGAAGWWFWTTRPVPATLATVTRGTAAEIVYATGAVEPQRWAAVASLSRERIVETCDCEGATVARGDPLFRLDDAAAQAHLRELDARLDLAEKSLTRAESLLERRVISPDRYDTALALVAELRAARASGAAELETLVVRAPLDGMVLRLDAEVGEAAEPGEPLAWVGVPTPLIIEAEVNEEDIPRVDIGQTALIKADAFPDRALPAEVASITPKGDPLLRTYRVRLALPGDTPLLIGMSVEVNIVIRTVEGAILAPASALIDGALQVVEEGRVRRAPVTVGIAGVEAVEILSGVEEGATVVAPADPALRDGARIRPAS
jgi:RND family efflux transporter MFP subunit